MSTHRRSREDWSRLLRQYRGSGLPVAAFCRRAWLSQASFYAWRRRLGAEPTFVELSLPPTPPAAPPKRRLRSRGRRDIGEMDHLPQIEQVYELPGELCRSTCQRHGIDPQRYFTQLLANLPTTPMSQLEEWLPDEWLKRNPPPTDPSASVPATSRGE